MTQLQTRPQEATRIIPGRRLGTAAPAREDRGEGLGGPSPDSNRKTLPVSAWFGRWLRLHARCCHHERWKHFQGASEDATVAMSGWQRAFEREGVTPLAAQYASYECQRVHDLPFPERQLPYILRFAREYLDAERRRQSEQDRAERRLQFLTEREQMAETRQAWDAMPAAEQARRIERERATIGGGLPDNMVRSCALARLNEELWGTTDDATL